MRTLENGPLRRLTAFGGVSLGSLAALLVGHLPVRWTVWGELTLCALSMLMAACVFVMVALRSIWLCYGSYVLFRATYMLLITVAT